tara:strand:- start:278 stop:502 length:225 start_codon:yes stop_codon:yes gene_type:complete
MVGVEDHFHRVVETGEVFVNGIVDDFPNAVMKGGPIMGVTEVHSGAFSDGLEAFENLDAASVIIIAHRITFFGL